ncbi:TPA: iron ABC transporter permease [Candidatus Sumerlaeota bacterium]|nr:iron ABC transporter permease [Candidatus Sumerlaeota bacterium]
MNISMGKMVAVQTKQGKAFPVLTGLVIALITSIIFSLAMGRYGIPLRDLFSLLLAKVFPFCSTDVDAVSSAVLFRVRMPRILAATLVGAALASSGASYQGIFKNPMVSPDLLGASAGASFGVALGIMLGFNVILIQFIAFGFGLLAVLTTCAVSARIGRNQDSILIMTLSGILVGSIFMSFVTLIKYVADHYSKMPAITFWLMGSLSAVNVRDLWFMLVPMVLGLTPLLLLRWKLNVLALGDEEAKALGVNTGRIRFVIIICATLMTAAAVSISGIIGWVGLVVPHLTRMLVGPNYRVLLPASALIGGAYLLLMDDLARLACATELPLGVLTALIGAPFFIFLLMRTKKGWA